MTATTGAVSWTIRFHDDADVKRVSLSFDVAPVTSEDVTLTLTSAAGATFDVLIRNMDAQTCPYIVFEDIDGVKKEDALLVEYTNSDGNSITGICTYDILAP